MFQIVDLLQADKDLCIKKLLFKRNKIYNIQIINNISRLYMYISFTNLKDQIRK